MKRLRIWLIGLWRGDLVAIFLAIAVVDGAAALWSTGHLMQLWDFGFGSDWHCTWYGKGEPVCFKAAEKPSPR